MNRLLSGTFLFLLVSFVAFADSGGVLIREQAAYDVKFYYLNLKIDPSTRSISGFAGVRAVTQDTLSQFVLDLNSNFIVDSMKWKSTNDTGLSFQRIGGRIWAVLPHTVGAGDTVVVETYYHGQPKVSTDPPWDDGFVWSTSAGAKPWDGVACEMEGGDAWWPCKDHPSDEPDSVSLSFRVPSDLVCVSNGKLVDTVSNLDGTKTYKWFVSTPINNYDVTFYLGDYVRIPVSYTSVTGDTVPSEYWFLPGSVDTAKTYIPLFLRDVRFLEEKCGPFPFRADKYGIAEAPYWGMEHQTIIAYGNNFHFNSYGFDYIHLHEFAHEWWGNLVTAKDWSDVWIHEGLATYMEALYAEYLHGAQSYRNYMAGLTYFSNSQPVAPRAALTASQAFSTNDVYYKAAWIVHTLRYLLGDSTFFTLLHRWAYPDTAMERVTDGRQCRLATTDDFLQIAEEVSGTTLDWFFEAYFRQAALPMLHSGIINDTLYLRWTVQNDIPFPMPVEVNMGGTIVRVNISGGSGKIAIPAGVTPQVDPNNRILKNTSSFLTGSVAYIDFPGVNVGATATDSVTIMNESEGTLNITSVSSDSADFRILPPMATVGPRASHKFYIAFSPADVRTTSGYALFSYNSTDPPYRVFLSGSGLMPRSTFSVSKDWNIISVPLKQNDPRRSMLFPTAISTAYLFNSGSGYVSTDSLESGRGYWLKFDSDQSISLSGLPRYALAIDVKARWNIVGSISKGIPSSSVVSVGTSIRSSFFGYHHGYFIADTIQPGKGYWVKVTSDGQLYEDSSFSSSMRASGLFKENPGANRIIIRDNSGNEQTLYFGKVSTDKPDVGEYEMPPAAPSGLFDARFASDRLVELVEDGRTKEFPVLISSAAYPITIRWEQQSPLQAVLRVGTKEIPLTADGVTSVGDAKAQIALVVNGISEVPKVFALEQNFPNPFNPVTIVNYQLPSDNYVSLKIYSVLGQEVMTLVNGMQEAGYRSVSFDGSNLPSGVYFYRLTAGSFSAMKKMLLLK
jgi:hypothetical protein